jgi:hypothetical protein
MLPGSFHRNEREVVGSRVDIAQAYLTIRERGGTNHHLLKWPNIGNRHVLDHNLRADHSHGTTAHTSLISSLRVSAETARHYGLFRREDRSVGVLPGQHLPKPTARNPSYHRLVHPSLCSETVLASYGTAHNKFGNPLYGFFTTFGNGELRFLSPREVVDGCA